MKIILMILTGLLFLLCFQINIIDNPERVKESVRFYQNIHLIYLGVFLLLSAIVYFIINRRQLILQQAQKTPAPRQGNRKNQIPAYEVRGGKPLQSHPDRILLYLLGLLCAGFLLRMVIAVTIPGHPYDIKAFIHWSAAAARNLSGIYTDSMIPPRYTLTYPPVYLYVLGFIGNLVKFFQINSDTIFIAMLKLPAIIADIITGYILYKFSIKYLSYYISLFIVWLYVFNPVTLFNSALWGQVDSFFMLFIISGLLLIHAGQLPWASSLLTAAVLTKPQGIFVLPVLLWELIRCQKFNTFLWSGLAALSSFLLIIAPFSMARGPFWIIAQFVKTAKQFPYATVNAYNVYALFGANLKYDSGNFFLFNYYTWGAILIMGLLGFGTYLYYCRHQRDNPQSGLSFLTALLLSVGIFVVATRMHERYLFPAFAIGLLTYIRFPDRRILYLFGAFTVTNYLNITKVCFDAFHQSVYGPDWIVFAISLANLLLLVYLIKISINLIKNETIPGME